MDTQPFTDTELAAARAAMECDLPIDSILADPSLKVLLFLCAKSKSRKNTTPMPQQQTAIRAVTVPKQSNRTDYAKLRCNDKT